MRISAFARLDDVTFNYIRSSEKHNMEFRHYHDMYEIFFILDGRRYLLLDNMCHTLEAGSLVVLAPFDMHQTLSRDSDYYERYVLNFQLDKLKLILNDWEVDILNEKLKSCIIHLTDAQRDILHEHFVLMERLMQAKGIFAKKMVYSSIFLILTCIVSCISDEDALPRNSIPQTIINALTYINQNYNRLITLDELSETVRLSKYHFSRSFKDVTGFTVMEYLNNYRLSKVHSLLIDTDAVIEDIAVETGFSSVQNLRNAFKKAYGESPSKVRKNAKKLV